MYLKSLELSGFKSFAKKTELGFNTAITSIVGPNGSGKSNVAEAFRFVLGEQSIKSLRGKRSEDMIFNGSRTMGRMARASVKMTLDNRKRLLNIDFDEVTIERVVHRDNNNDYLINGSVVRLKDIVELLAQAHMGPTGHHIISQGEADRILNANLKERRLMIEDALGLKIYQYKRAESERKLLRTHENIAQVESLRRELAPHLKFLKKQVEKVEKAKELRSELAVLYTEYLSREHTYLTAAGGSLSDEEKGPKEKLTDLEQVLAKARKTLEGSKRRDDKSAQVLEFERILRDLRTQKDELVRDAGRIEGELAGEERRLKKLREISDQEEHRTVPFTEVREFAKVLGQELSNVEKGEDISKACSIIARIKSLLADFIKRFESARDERSLGEVESEIKVLQGQRAELDARLGGLEKSEKESQAAYERLRVELEKEKDESREAERDIFRIMAESNEIRAKLNLLKSREDTLKLEKEEYERERKEAIVLVGAEVLRQAEEMQRSEESEERSLQYDRRRHLEKIKIRLEEMGSGESEEMLKEYQDASNRDSFLEREVLDLEKSAESLQTLIKELTEKLDFEFKEGVRRINTQFEEFFKLMFGGGVASLVVVRPEKRKRRDEEDILAEGEMPPEEEETEEGIEIRVSLPHKKIKGLEVLSGGERALTSIALLFAISQVNPPPFIILDETDAALDEANSRKYGDMIDTLSKYSQLVLITHNRETMSRAGVLYGVTMGNDGVSKLLSIQFEEAIRVAK
ncbi:MAG TPA: AAA family ATPase [Candidatus Paceibacterota bacterium]